MFWPVSTNDKRHVNKYGIWSNPAPATKKSKARSCTGLFLCLPISHPMTALHPKADIGLIRC